MRLILKDSTKMDRSKAKEETRQVLTFFMWLLQFYKKNKKFLAVNAKLTPIAFCLFLQITNHMGSIITH
jgi:hypothetical protein